MSSEVEILTAALSQGCFGFMVSNDRRWSFCMEPMRKLWTFPEESTYWLQLTSVRKPGSWRIRCDKRGVITYVDPGCPCLGSTLLRWRIGINNLLRRLSRRGLLNKDLYVRLFYQ